MSKRYSRILKNTKDCIKTACTVEKCMHDGIADLQPPDPGQNGNNNRLCIEAGCMMEEDLSSHV